MRLTPIEGSELLVGYRWDESTEPGVGTLVVEFRDGSVWGYRGVPLGVLASFQMAESRGGYLLRYVKPAYEGEKLRDAFGA